MGNKNSLTLEFGEIKQINEETGFSTVQIEKLYNRFSQLDRNNLGILTRAEFLSIPELATNPMCDRLVQMFFQESENIDFRRFIQVLASFHANNTNASVPQSGRGSNTMSEAQGSTSGKKRRNLVTDAAKIVLDKMDRKPDGLNASMRMKLEFLFRVYDVNNDGRISFNDLRSILELMVGNDIEDIQLDKIATRAFVELDEDSDGIIQFEEFCRTFSSEDLEEKLRVRFFG